MCALTERGACASIATSTVATAKVRVFIVGLLPSSVDEDWLIGAMLGKVVARDCVYRPSCTCINDSRVALGVPCSFV